MPTEPLNINTVLILVVAVLNFFGAMFSMWAHKSSRVAAQSALRTETIALQTEKNTNSMKDALVNQTREAAHAAGKEEGRIAGEAKAATLAEGRLAQETKL